MASYVKKIKNEGETNCCVCRNRVTGGRRLPDYSEHLGLVCEDCYKRYFSDIAAIERLSPGVLYRPADIIKDRYRRQHIFRRVLAAQTVRWAFIGGVMWLMIWAVTAIYGAKSTLPFAAAPCALYAVFSAAGAVVSLFELAKGIAGGMDHSRRLLLLLKAVVFAGLAAAAAAGAINALGI